MIPTISLSLAFFSPSLSRPFFTRRRFLQDVWTTIGTFNAHIFIKLPCISSPSSFWSKTKCSRYFLSLSLLLCHQCFPFPTWFFLSSESIRTQSPPKSHFSYLIRTSQISLSRIRSSLARHLKKTNDIVKPIDRTCILVKKKSPILISFSQTSLIISTRRRRRKRRSEN